jgi:hypothetical protein
MFVFFSADDGNVREGAWGGGAGCELG